MAHTANCYHIVHFESRIWVLGVCIRALRIWASYKEVHWFYFLKNWILFHCIISVDARLGSKCERVSLEGHEHLSESSREKAMDSDGDMLGQHPQAKGWRRWGHGEEIRLGGDAYPRHIPAVRWWMRALSSWWRSWNRDKVTAKTGHWSTCWTLAPLWPLCFSGFKLDLLSFFSQKDWARWPKTITQSSAWHSLDSLAKLWSTRKHLLIQIS